MTLMTSFVQDIFDNPQFIIDGATASDVRQGSTIADCWFLAAVSALSGSKDLLTRLCVDRDEQAGVYGFVFFRGKPKRRLCKRIYVSNYAKMASGSRS